MGQPREGRDVERDHSVLTPDVGQQERIGAGSARAIDEGSDLVICTQHIFNASEIGFAR
jgi:orotidine-5'-phosphate decarboxylase